MSSYFEIKNKIESISKKEVKLLAVSKKQDIHKILELYKLGQRDFAENYVQELVEKATQIKQMGIEDIRWHFIGHLQTNKVKLLYPHVSEIQSVDSEKLFLELEKVKAKNHYPPVGLMVQVRVDQDSKQKTGCLPGEAVLLASRIQNSSFPFIGFMAIPKTGELREAYQCLVRLKKQAGFKETKLSLGMSDDFEEAVSLGSDCVRIGTALFGERKS